MYIDELIEAFESAVKDSYPELINSELISNISQHIKNKKFDIQDQTLIETFLKEDLDHFKESFSDSLNKHIGGIEDSSTYLNSEEGHSNVIQLYIKSIENMIDYYYNSIISKQFSST